MVRVTPFLLVLSLALMAHGFPERKCVLTGNWKNDLGSNMTIGELQGNGTFNGTYLTAVSMSPKKILKSPLLGSQQHTNQPTFGFTVNWTFTGASPSKPLCSVPRTALPSLWCSQRPPPFLSCLHRSLVLHCGVPSPSLLSSIVSPDFSCASCCVPRAPCDVPDALLPFPAVHLMIPRLLLQCPQCSPIPWGVPDVSFPRP
uniref:Avidin n=1 Tax=Otus sunia TaxID=257818 RepID=A0A8C8ARC8_9STRI